MNIVRRTLLAAALTGILASVSGMAISAEQYGGNTGSRNEQIYGYSLMTPQERDEYRAKMRNARTAEERQAIREQHHVEMVQRAKDRGVLLPDTPPQAGGQMGPGGGMGPGMGPGGGMGRGSGMGSGRGRPY